MDLLRKLNEKMSYSPILEEYVFKTMLRTLK